jgi:hypothetical protein
VRTYTVPTGRRYERRPTNTPVTLIIRSNGIDTPCRQEMKYLKQDILREIQAFEVLGTQAGECEVTESISCGDQIEFYTALRNRLRRGEVVVSGRDANGEAQFSHNPHETSSKKILKVGITKPVRKKT